MEQDAAFHSHSILAVPACRGNCLQWQRNDFLHFWILRFLRTSKCRTNLHGPVWCYCKTKQLSVLKVILLTISWGFRVALLLRLPQPPRQYWPGGLHAASRPSLPILQESSRVLQTSDLPLGSLSMTCGNADTPTRS